MKIEIRREEEMHRSESCKICERNRTGLDVGVLVVTKQAEASTEPVDAFVICGICSAKIAIIVGRHHLEIQQRAPQRAPPPHLPTHDGRGGA